jgi:uncharacterized membrane protein YgcG
VPAEEEDGDVVVPVEELKYKGVHMGERGEIDGEREGRGGGSTGGGGRREGWRQRGRGT